MTITANIPLAEGNWDSISELLVIVVFLVIAGIGAIAKKIRETQEEQKAKRAEQGFAERDEETQAPRRTQPRETPQARSAGEALQMLRERRRADKIHGKSRSAYEQPVKRTPAPPQPVVELQRTPPAAPITVNRIAKRRRRMQIEEQAKRDLTKRRLQPVTMPPATAAVEPATTEQTFTGLNSANALRQAILYHEIFSAPKALRKEPEMWDAL